MSSEIPSELITAMEGLESSAEENFRGEVVPHGIRVGDLSRRFAEHLGWPPLTVHHLSVAGRFHDIGKLGIPAELLGKNGPLTDLEKKIMRSHTRRGFEIVSSVMWSAPQAIPEAVLYHHERWDGAGYEKLRGHRIPVLAMMISIADVFDALISPRAYKGPLAAVEALRIMIAGETGTNCCFDPVLLRHFVKWLSEGQDSDQTLLSFAYSDPAPAWG